MHSGARSLHSIEPFWKHSDVQLEIRLTFVCVHCGAMMLIVDDLRTWAAHSHTLPARTTVSTSAFATLSVSGAGSPRLAATVS